MTRTQTAAVPMQAWSGTLRIEEGFLVGYDPEMDCTFCGDALPTIHNDEVLDHEDYQPSVNEWEVQQ